MYHIVVISENRILLKEIYEMIEDNSLFRIHIVPFSMDAYDVFYENHTDIVILDTSVFLPYSNILEQLKQCQWHYHVLLLHDGKPDFSLYKDAFWLNKSKLSKELFREVLTDIQKHTVIAQKENITVTFDWKGTQTLSIHPDAYYLILVKCFEVDDVLNSSVIKDLITKCSDYCTLHKLFQGSNEILFYISRSDIKKQFNFTLLSQLMFQILGYQTALLYEKNINWKRFSDACQEMKIYESYCYFLSGELMYLSDIKELQSHVTEKDLKNQCSLLLQALLCNDDLTAKHILQDLYLHTIKSSLQFHTREYIRVQLLFLHFFIAREGLNYPYLSVEQELEGIMNTSLFQHNSYPSNHVQEILCTTVQTIYNQYHTSISLEGIADELNLNKIYLGRIFKEHFGLTILETLQNLRLLDAKYYLLHSEKKVAEIAEETGFTDAGYFSKFFRKATGCTALEFRMKRNDEKEMRYQYEGIMAI